MHPPAASISELTAVLRGVSFLGGCDVAVHDCARGTCDLVLAFDSRHERPGGIVSGMMIMGLADVAMWLAIMTNRGTHETWVTTDMKTAFLRSARRESITCRAIVLKQGSRATYGTVETNGESSGLLAHHVIAYARVSDSR